MSLKSLIEDLERFNEQYREAFPSDAEFFDYTAAGEYKLNQKLVRSGKLIKEFYKNTLVTKYSRSSDPKVRGAFSIVYDIYKKTLTSLDNNDYLGLSLALYTEASSANGPSHLEQLADDLKNHSIK